MSCKINTINRCYIYGDTKQPLSVSFNIDISEDRFEYSISKSFSSLFTFQTPIPSEGRVLLNIPELPVGRYTHKLVWTRAGVVRTVFFGSILISEAGCKDCGTDSDLSFTLTDETLSVEVDLGEVIKEVGAVNYYTEIAVNPRGEYVSGHTYNKGDAVSLLGSSYLCTTDSTTVPPVSATGELNAGWQLNAEKGAQYNDTELQNRVTELDERKADVTFVNQLIAGVFRPKGSVDTYVDLANIEAEEGWVYNILADGSNVVWVANLNNTGAPGWDDLAGIVDLSDYQKISQANAALALKVDKVAGKGLSTNDYTDAEKTKLANLVAIEPVVGELTINSANISSFACSYMSIGKLVTVTGSIKQVTTTPDILALPYKPRYNYNATIYGCTVSVSATNQTASINVDNVSNTRHFSFTYIAE